MRLCSLSADGVAPASQHFSWTAKYIKELDIRAFGVSDNINTVHRDYSWIIKNVKFSAGKTKEYGSYDNSCDTYEMLANIFNGKTPTGTDWTADYDKAYVWFSGHFVTFGSWTSMYEGKDYKSYVKTGTDYAFRCGGHPYHCGEFIHSNCNGYDKKDHSITGLISWKNPRVFWVRLGDENPFFVAPNMLN